MIFFVFFSGKNLKICLRLVLIFSVYFYFVIFFSSSVHFSCLKKFEQQKLKRYEKRDGLFVSIIRFPSEIQILPFAPDFSS